MDHRPLPFSALLGLAEVLYPISISLPHHLEYHLTVSIAIIQLQEDDLLPGAQHKLPTAEGHHQAGPEERGADMVVAVSIMPEEVMGIVQILGGNSLQGISQVCHQTILMLDGGNRSRRSGNEDRYHSCVQGSAL